MFQSTHPHGVRLGDGLGRNRSQLFQSTHPHGVRLKASRGRIRVSTGFNPRTHTGCDIEEGDIFIQGLFQSTHPHGVRRRTASISSRSPIVSIHAPTRGATSMEVGTGKRLMVSIHAPTRGATHHLETTVKDMKEFQSTHPHGVRQCAKLHIISQ